MTSALFENALQRLGPLADKWRQDIRPRFEGVVEPDSPNGDGRHIIAHIETENHLSKAPSALDGGLFAALLSKLVSAEWPDDPARFSRLYEELIAPFELVGPLIGHQIRKVYRYINGYGIFRLMAEALKARNEAFLYTMMNERIGRAIEETQGALWHEVLAFARSPEVWKHLGSVSLARRRAMFVTFEFQNVQRYDSAEKIHSALALWKPLQSCLIEVSYPSNTMDQFRIPTFADAGWYRWFKGCALGEPHGWTSPHHVDLSPQPEAVQERQDLSRDTARIEMRIVRQY